MKWVLDVLVWVGISVLAFCVIDILISTGIEANFFGSWTQGIATIWPQIKMFLLLIALLVNIWDHRPRKYDEM